MSKQFWGVILAIIGVSVIIFLSSGAHSTVIGKPSHNVEGANTAGVALVEFADFQCPYCGADTIQLQQVLNAYKPLISFQFINFPLVSIHPNAFAGARAAQAAALQGKFWQMHNLLYQQNILYYSTNNPNTWISAPNPLVYFDKYAAQIGLNVKKFNKDYASNQVNGTVNADMSLGNKLGVNATPTFYVNGKQVVITNSNKPLTYYLETAINAALRAKGIQPPAAVANPSPTPPPTQTSTPSSTSQSKAPSTKP